MNKKVLKLFIVLFLVFLFTNTVNASLVCNPEDEEVTITEPRIDDAGFDATLPVCEWHKTGEFEPVGEGHDSYTGAYDSGYDLELVYVETIDGKDVIGKKVPKCSSSDRYVSAVVTCTHTKSAGGPYYTTNTCSDKSESECTGGCTWTPGEDGEEGTCGGSNSKPYYQCSGTGYSPTDAQSSSYNCTRTQEYTYASVTDGEDIVADASSKFGVEGSTCTAVYTLQCPTYECKRVYKNFELCTPEFEIDGQPAYCVNPSQKFNQGNDNYQWDESFNIFDCESSYSTVDCGYANILIEGAYYNTTDDAINSALRLWSIHSGQAGDEKTGVANVTGSGCNDITYFTVGEDDQYVNVYKHTYDYIMDFAKEKFYDVAKGYEHIPTEESCTSRSGDLTGNTFEKILCLNATELSELNNGTANQKIKHMKGVMCGDDPDYREAFELFFNTVIGNKCMKHHLSALYGGGDGSKPIAATLQSEFSMEEWTEGHVTESWVEVQFEHESFWSEITDEEVGCSKKDLNKLRTKLINEGKTAEQADAIIAQIEPYCSKVKVKIIDEDGNEIITEQDMEKCSKGKGCRTTKFRFAVCDIVENSGKDLEIVVTYERTRSSYSVRKYYSCANANVNQTLFAFFKDKTEEEEGGDEGDPTEVDRKVTETSFAITNYKCTEGCDDPRPRTEGKAECENDQNNYNGVYNAKVKDPSLKCILNLNNVTDKERFDYSDYFGVNTNFCRVYCSDEIEYILADKVKAISGRTFMYNIEFPAKKTNDLNYKLTSVIEEKRTCVSEIYYRHLSNLNVLKSAYGLTDEEFATLKTSKTFDGLFNVLKAKAGGENERNDNLNQIIYDIYNCNFYSKDKIEEAGVDIPRNYKSTLLKKVQDVYKKNNNYGLGSDEEGNKTSEVSKDIVKYGFGAVIKDSTGTTNRVNNVGNTATFTGKLSSISYCKDDLENGEYCYGYDPNADDELSYNYPTNKPGAKKTYTLYRGKNIKVPTNDYARFEVTSEINYYNNNKYQADMGSGKVVLGSGDSSLLTLPSNSYPVDKNAYNLDACNQSIAGGLYHRCTVTQTLSPLNFYRKDTASPLSFNSDNVFKCYVDVQKPNCDDPTKETCEFKSATLYRNVDPANIFPSGNTRTDSNWSTDNGIRAKEEIESTADILKTDEEKVDASITLGPSQIENIKQFNIDNGFSDELIYNCEKDPVDGIYYNCNSYFLDILRGNATEYSSGSYGNINVDNMK